jgi:hypothetical protein
MSKAKKETRIDSIIRKVQQRFQPATRFISKLDRKSRVYTMCLILAAGLLLTTSVYAGRHASDDYSTNSNAHMLTHLFSGHTDYPVVLPGPHATLIIIPLVYIQGHLPYHYTSFTLVNIALVVATMFGWAFLMIKLFGRRYEIPILVILSSLIFTSVAFSYSLAYTTIRNIEYPLALWFVMIVASVLSGTRYSRKQFILAAIGSILFAIILAGDSLFNYAIVLPLLLVLAWYWVQSQAFTINLVKALGLVGGTLIGAALLKYALSAAGLITFDYTFATPTGLSDAARLAPSFSVALTETLNLHGAYIFAKEVGYHNIALFINFGLLLAGLAGFGLIISKANRSFRRQEGTIDEANFVAAVMAISFLVTFLVFVTSGFAIAFLPDGKIVSAENARYISLLPLLTVVSLVWILKNYYAKHIAFICVLCVVLVAGIVASRPVISSAYSSGTHKLEISASRDSINDMLGILQKSEVTQVSADYWYGHVLYFWSNHTINIQGPVSCDTSSMIVDADHPLFSRQKHNVAFIIDRGERNYSAFWSCTDEQLATIYGAPDETFEVTGAGSNPPVKIWIYKNTP